MTCDKISYSSYKEAMSAVKPTAKRLKQSFKVYKCPDCKMFHLYSMANKKLQPKPKDKYKKKHFEDMVTAKKEKKIVQGDKPVTDNLTSSSKYKPASQKVLSPSQVLFFKAIINNGNKD